MKNAMQIRSYGKNNKNPIYMPRQYLENGKSLDVTGN